MQNRTRRAPHRSVNSTRVAVASVSKVDGYTTAGRRDDNTASARVDIRDATYRIGDVVNSKHKRVGG